MRLAHGWRLVTSGVPRATTRDFLRPAIRAVPGAMARRLVVCEISLPAELAAGNAASRWVMSAQRIEIEVAWSGVEPHDLALEVLVCLGQALWEMISHAERSAWLLILRMEIDDLVSGEIDEQALDEKHRLLSSRAAARSRRRLESYCRASFAGTVAEYVHSLWHDVTIRTGADHLPAQTLRRRFELLSEWFPPNRGYRLFPDR